MPPSVRVLSLILIAALPTGVAAQGPMRLGPSDRPEAGTLDNRDLPKELFGRPRQGAVQVNYEEPVQLPAHPASRSGNPESMSGPPEPPRRVPVSPSPEPQATRTLSPSNRAAPIPLSSPDRSERGKEGNASSRIGGFQSLVTVGSSLAIVLGLFFVVAWMLRRTTPGNSALLPGDVVEVLGRTPLASRQQVHLIRLGSKLVLISVTPAGVEALSEVTDPEEVVRLTGLCRQAQPNSSTAMFRQMLDQFTGEHRKSGLASARSRREASGEGNDV